MFKLNGAAKNLFSTLNRTEYYKIDFDIFYYCSVIGLARGRKEESSGNNEITKSIPNTYKNGEFKEVILTLLSSEIKYRGILKDDRRSLRDFCSEILDANEINDLTPAGHKLLNDYCEGGYQIFHENRMRFPSSGIGFIDFYLKILNEMK